MSYLVLARKYRPQTLGDLVGQGAVAQTLTNAIEQDRLSHALLLCGPRGVGKTSTARILAKSINCSTSPGANPCGTCYGCKIATEGGDSFNVIEVDGASNNGVENIRELRDDSKYKDKKVRYKIIIIDEVHMLSTPAFNALLKILEEPPPHVKFIFATTEVHKVPETIRSRTQRFDFKLVPPAGLFDHLSSICKSEDIPYEDEALLAIATGGRGSVRDSLTLLDQAIVYANGTITAATVTAMTGALTFEKAYTIASRLIQHKGGEALDFVDQLLNDGVAVDQIFGQLIEIYRALMIVPENPKGIEGMFNLTPNQVELLRNVRWSQESAIYALQILNQSRTQAGLYPDPRVALEMALIRCARIENIIALADIVSGKKKSDRPLEVTVQTVVPEVTQLAPPIEPKISSATNNEPQNKKEAPISSAETSHVCSIPSPEGSRSEAHPKETTRALDPFQHFIESVQKRFPSFASLLTEAKQEIEEDVIRFIIINADPIKMERLCARSEKLETYLKEAYGTNVSLQLEAYEDPEESSSAEQTSDEPAPFLERSAPLKSMPTPAESPLSTSSEPIDLPWENDPRSPSPLPSNTASERPSASPSTLMEKANRDPGVQALKSAFNCSIVNVKEPSSHT